MRTERLRDERGDTLVEVLVAVVIIGLAATAIMGSLLISINSSSVHRYLADDDTLARSAIDMVKQQIEIPSVAGEANPPASGQSKFIDCSSSPSVDPGSPQAANPQVILSDWRGTTDGGSYQLTLPAAPSGYSISLSRVECVTATAGTPPTIVPDGSCYATPTVYVPTNCSSAGNRSGIVQFWVSVEDPSGYTLTMSSYVRNPNFGSGYATSY